MVVEGVCMYMGVYMYKGVRVGMYMGVCLYEGVYIQGCVQARMLHPHPHTPTPTHLQDPTKWVHTTDDFVAIKLLLPTCRSNKSPKGVAPYNHLCDGKALLVLVRRCNQLQYAQFLFELSQVGACRGRFPFVDIVDVVAMRVEPQGEESSWNVDGELLDDTRVSVQVHAGLIDVFARGPDV